MTTPIGAGAVALDMLFEYGVHVEVMHEDGVWRARSELFTTHGDTRKEVIERIRWMIRASRRPVPSFSRSGT